MRPHPTPRSKRRPRRSSKKMSHSISSLLDCSERVYPPPSPRLPSTLCELRRTRRRAGAIRLHRKSSPFDPGVKPVATGFLSSVASGLTPRFELHRKSSPFDPGAPVATDFLSFVGLHRKSPFRSWRKASRYQFPFFCSERVYPAIRSPATHPWLISSNSSKPRRSI